MDGPIEEALVELLAGVSEKGSITPEQVARAAGGEAWRRLLPRVRSLAIGMARQGRLVILRKGKPVEPDELKGVWRMAPPR